jgi:hypothetical protein
VRLVPNRPVHISGDWVQDVDVSGPPISIRVR